MKKRVWRAVTEAGFIIFLFYSNLLMGEFERSGMGRQPWTGVVLGAEGRSRRNGVLVNPSNHHVAVREDHETSNNERHCLFYASHSAGIGTWARLSSKTEFLPPSP